MQEQDNRGLGDFDLSKLRILVVEDQPRVLNVMRRALAFNKANLTLADSGAKALVLVDEQKFDVILLDVQMPQLSGIDVVKHIRTHQDPQVRNTYVIAVTARANPGDREAILDAGFNEYMSKPVDLTELVRHLEQLFHED